MKGRVYFYKWKKKEKKKKRKRGECEKKVGKKRNNKLFLKAFLILLWLQVIPIHYLLYPIS
jgi:hypothetical protein